MGPSPLTLTDAAKKHIEDTAFAYGVHHIAMRVRMTPKGLKDGFELQLEEEPLEGDEVYVSNGIRFYLERALVAQVRGLTIDFHPRGGGAFVFRRDTA